MDKALRQSMLAVDTETSGLNWVFSNACGIVIGWGIENNYYIAIDHKDAEGQFIKQLKLEDVREPLQILLGNEDTLKIFWNAKFDLHVLRKCGIEVRGSIHDGLVMYHLLDENVSHGLKDASVTHIDPAADVWEKAVNEWRTLESRRRRSLFNKMLKARVKELEENWDYAVGDPPGVEVFKAQAKQEFKDHIYGTNAKDDVSYDFIPLDLITPYACADVHYTWLLFKPFSIAVSRNRHLAELYFNEMKLVKVLFEAESHGIKVDKAYLTQLLPKFDAEIEQAQKEVWEHCGKQFSISSDDELLEMLTEMQIPLTKVTKGTKEKQKAGDWTSPPKYSVDKEVLQTLASKHEFAAKILKFREAAKLKSTYGSGLLELLDSNDLIHTSFNANVSTGRMSCRDPNLQNIPASNKSIRRAFIVPNPEEYFYVFFDYSQVELRLTAHWSQDPLLMKCYPWEGHGTDVHTLTTANIVMNVPFDQVLTMAKDETGHDKSLPVCECPSCQVKFFRSIAKRVNFGIIYGAGPKAIQRQVSTPKRPVSEEDCELYIEKYLDTYSGVKDWIKNTRNDLRNHKEVINTFGRYRRFPKYNDKATPGWMKDRMARQACNFLIQGDAADLFKHAATRVHDILAGKKSKLVNFVHDEIQFYWHRDEMELLNVVKQAMQDFPQYKLPIIAEMAVSETSWADKKELK